MRGSLFGYFCGMIAVLAGAVLVLTSIPQISSIGNGRHYGRPASVRAVAVELRRHSPTLKREAEAKDVSPTIATAKADSKRSKHYKPKVFGRYPSNYGYGSALGYAEYGQGNPFFR